MKDLVHALSGGQALEEGMKKTYTTPAVLMDGSVIRETMGGTTGAAEPDGFNKNGGSVGFNL
jgi:hypothetical protein